MFIARSDEKPRVRQFNLIARYFVPTAACTHIFETHPSGGRIRDARAKQRVRYLFVMRIVILRAAASVIVIASERARTLIMNRTIRIFRNVSYVWRMRSGEIIQDYQK